MQPKNQKKHQWSFGWAKFHGNKIFFLHSAIKYCSKTHARTYTKQTNRPWRTISLWLIFGRKRDLLELDLNRLTSAPKRSMSRLFSLFLTNFHFQGSLSIIMSLSTSLWHLNNISTIEHFLFHRFWTFFDVFCKSNSPCKEFALFLQLPFSLTYFHSSRSSLFLCINHHYHDLNFQHFRCQTGWMVMFLCKNLIFYFTSVFSR